VLKSCPRLVTGGFQFFTGTTLRGKLTFDKNRNPHVSQRRGILVKPNTIHYGTFQFNTKILYYFVKTKFLTKIL